MTIVVARQFGERIVVLSDTMISGRDLKRPDILPGRLKSIVISEKVSIAYSGNANSAIDAIRKAQLFISKTGDLQRVICDLRDCSRKCDCEFIVTSHIGGPHIYKIWKKGEVTPSGHTYWIGDEDMASKLSRLIELEAPVFVPESRTEIDFPSEDEQKFRTAFGRLWLRDGTQLAEGVGGLLIDQLGSPHGHCYQGHAGVTAWDTTTFPPGLTEEQRRDRATGMTQYSYSICAPLERGVAVLGVFLEQAKIGFIYSPITKDEAHKLSPTTLNEVSEAVKRLANEMGGSVSEVDLPRGTVSS